MDPGEEAKRPMGQGWHVEGWKALGVAENEPLGHGVHVDPSRKEPVGHANGNRVNKTFPVGLSPGSTLRDLYSRIMGEGQLSSA